MTINIVIDIKQNFLLVSKDNIYIMQNRRYFYNTIAFKIVEIFGY